MAASSAFVIAGLVVGLAAVAAAQGVDGRYAGPGRGTSKSVHSTCSDMTAEVTIRAGAIDGVARRTVINNRTLSVEKHPLRGSLSADGKATLTLMGRPLRVTIANGRLVGGYVGPECDYDFELTLAN